MLNTHVDIPIPFRCWVLNKFFYNGEQIEKEFLTRCTVFAVSSYQGMVPSFIVRVDDNGAIFHNIPVHALISTKEFKLIISYQSLCYHNAPDYSITLNQHSYLAGEVQCFFPCGKYFGNYVLTIDWPLSNMNLHLIDLMHGQYCLLPNFRTLFKFNSNELPKYKKMRKVFRV